MHFFVKVGGGVEDCRQARNPLLAGLPRAEAPRPLDGSRSQRFPLAEAGARAGSGGERRARGGLTPPQPPAHPPSPRGELGDIRRAGGRGARGRALPAGRWGLC